MSHWIPISPCNVALPTNARDYFLLIPNYSRHATSTHSADLKRLLPCPGLRRNTREGRTVGCRHTQTTKLNCLSKLLSKLFDTSNIVDVRIKLKLLGYYAVFLACRGVTELIESLVEGFYMVADTSVFFFPSGLSPQ